MCYSVLFVKMQNIVKFLKGEVNLTFCRIVAVKNVIFALQLKEFFSFKNLTNFSTFKIIKLNMMEILTPELNFLIYLLTVVNDLCNIPTLPSFVV